MFFNETIVAVANLIPRVQHLPFLTSLYEASEYLDKIVLVGQLGSGEAIEKSYFELTQVCEVVHTVKLADIVADVTDNKKYRNTDTIGQARVQMFRCLAWELKKYNSKNCSVLFLDDDCCLNGLVLRKMLLKYDNLGNGVVCLQSDYRGNVNRLRQSETFDFFCTLVPSKFVKKACADGEFLNILGRFKTGGEFLFCDWYFKNLKCVFDLVRKGRSPYFMLHLNIKDKRKLWWDWSDKKWNKIEDALAKCKDIKEAETSLIGLGVINERVG